MTPRGKRDVAVDLAACVLAIYQCVGKVLAEQKPRLGATEEQARSAFTACSRQWRELAWESARDAVALAPATSVPTDGRSRIGLARQYVVNLGLAIDTDAAAALAVAMDEQLARGQHPEVAWQRAVAGYGLVTPAMRTYIAAATRADKSHTTATLTTAKLMAQRALLTQVDRIGSREATVWAELPLGTAKAAPLAKADELVAAGLAVRAGDTGRLLMLQRALDPKDPAAGTWEFPGGNLEKGEAPEEGAAREWKEEVGRRLPAGTLAGSWRHGIYQGFVLDIPLEADIPIHRGRGAVVNPDDPDGDMVEQLAWWSLDQLARNPAVRTELREGLPQLRAALAGEVVKAFDPDQRRDEDGKWTAGGRARLRLVERPEETATEAVPVDRYAVATPDRYATAAPDRYATAVDRYAAAQTDRYAVAAAPAEDRYAAPVTDRYAVAAPTSHRVLVYLVGADPNKAPAPAPVVVDADDDVFGMYVPMQGLAGYFYDHAKKGVGAHDTDAVNFQVIRDWKADIRNEHEPVEAVASRSPWSVAAGIEGISDDDWRSALALAVPLWDEVGENPERAINALGPSELAEVIESAGYGPRSGIETKRLIVDNEFLRANGVSQGRDSNDEHIRYDEGLSDALADYVVWHNPGVMGSAGKALENLLGHRGLRAKLDMNAVPGVLNLSSGLGPDDDASDLAGNYRVGTVHYHSAIGEHRHGAPNGKIALRETHIEPE